MALIENIEDRDIQKFEIERSIVSNKQVIGSFALNTASIKLINYSKRYNNLKNSWIKTKMGDLYVYDAPETQGEVTIELKCYDLAHKFDQAYNITKTFPMTVSEWLQAICDEVGVELATPTFTNSEVSLEAQPFLAADASFRNAVAEIAGAAGGFAQIISNRLHIKWFENTKHEILDWFSLTQQEQSSPINVVVLGRGAVEDNIVFPAEIPDNPYELRIDDNQILYEREQDLIEPIFNQVNGFSYRIFELKTIGLKKLYPGQKVQYRDFNNSLIETYVMTNNLTFLGGDYDNPNAWQSKIASVELNETSTNYNYAGSVIKTLNKTSAKVDKANQEIEFLVSSQQSFEGKVNENFTKVTQNISSVITSVQNSGGNNLIKNSAMYFNDSDGNPTHWDLSDNSILEVLPTADANNHGALSGQLIRLANATISQVVSVVASEEGKIEQVYSFSCRVYKTAVGSAKISLTDGINIWKQEFPIGEETIYQEIAFEGICPKSNELTLEIFASSDADLRVMDMMLSSGDYRSKWTQANGELANTDVKIDISGIEINSANTETSSHLTSQGLEIKRKGNTVTSITNVGVEANRGKFREEITMSPIKIVPQRDGWAFVKSE